MSQDQERLNDYTSKADPSKVKEIEDNLGGMKRGPIAKVWNNVLALFAMIKDPNAAWGSRAIAIGALLYLISPVDAIPDVIPVLGLTDDAGVIALAVAKLAKDLAKYKR